MFMQSNEPFQRVQDGMSPQTSGLLGAIAIGGAAAASQGLQYASYTGIDKEFEFGREKIGNLQEKLQTINPTKPAKPVRNGQQRVDKLNGQMFNTFQKHNQAEATRAAKVDLLNHNGASSEIRDIKSRLHNNESISRKEMRQLQEFNRNQGSIRRGVQDDVIKLDQQITGHRESMDRMQQKRNAIQDRMATTEVENRKYTKTNEQIQRLQDKYSQSNFESQKAAHRWHGKTAGRAALITGGFAAAGYASGAVLQSAVNRMNNA